MVCKPEQEEVVPEHYEESSALTGSNYKCKHFSVFFFLK